MDGRFLISVLLAAFVLAHAGCLIEPRGREGLPVVEHMRDKMNRRVRWSNDMPYQQDGYGAYYDEPEPSRFKAVPTRDVFASNPIYGSAPGPLNESKPEVYVPDNSGGQDIAPTPGETLPPPNDDSNFEGSEQNQPPNANPNSVLTHLNPPASSSGPDLKEAKEEELPGWRPLRR